MSSRHVSLPPRRRQGPARRAGLGLVGVVMGVCVLTVLVGLAAVLVLPHDDGAGEVEPAGSAPAPVTLDMTGFDAEHIIDDEVFYDSAAMDGQEVADFIARVNDGCRSGQDGTVCLASATFTSEDREPTPACPGGYTGAQDESAAQIVSKVASSCGVNPQVLLVLLHKEQGLLTASGQTLTSWDYEAATGYACPDGAACDPQWAGFFRQVYGAASQFQRYRLSPGSYQVVAGVPTQVAYSPSAGCGGAELTVRNQATAGLYDYTPYQPNEAVAWGGDGCSSWGNWNFYGYFRTFFGDPTPSTP
ncbi:hemagglutinin [Actinomyces faecalis]|uniref:hemagglutinin n=1 Tax=Actinomyces faecalis TaxID=2722820 RepID=UPI001FD1C57C|nr:hemagglutinin [Actinomyces faecalis]